MLSRSFVSYYRAMIENEIVSIILKERIRLSAAMWTIVRDTHAVEDLLQELVLRAMDQRARFTDGEQVVAWVRLAARHRAIDYVRVRDGRARILEENVLELLARQLESQPDELLDSQIDALRCCVEKLPEKSRQLVKLRYSEGFSGAEIAERLKRTRDAVYQSLSRLHRSLRDCVQGQLKTSPVGGEGVE